MVLRALKLLRSEHDRSRKRKHAVSRIGTKVKAHEDDQCARVITGETFELGRDPLHHVSKRVRHLDTDL